MTCCGQLGILRVRNDEQGMDSLVYCGCSWSNMDIQPWELPILNSKIKSAFTIEHCPREWFIPDNAPNTILRGPDFDETVSPKIQSWHGRLKAAETFWKDWGTVFEDIKTHWSDR